MVFVVLTMIEDTLSNNHQGTLEEFLLTGPGGYTVHLGPCSEVVGQEERGNQRFYFY